MFQECGGVRMRDLEQELFNTIKVRLLEAIKVEDNSIGYDFLLLAKTIEQLHTEVIRQTFIELLSLAVLDVNRFFAIRDVIKMALLLKED